MASVPKTQYAKCGTLHSKFNNAAKSYVRPTGHVGCPGWWQEACRGHTIEMWGYGKWLTRWKKCVTNFYD